AIERAGDYHSSRDVRPWLLGILANHVRKERRRSVRLRQDQEGEQRAARPGDSSPVVAAERLEFGSAARAAIKKLPSPFGEPIRLHLQHGLTAAEIGEVLGRPAGTVRTQLVRGMEKLRALLPAGFTAAALSMVLTPGPILAAVRRNVLASLSAQAAAGAGFTAVGSSSWLLFQSWRLSAMTILVAGVALFVSFPFWSAAALPPAPVAAAVAPGAPAQRVATSPLQRSNLEGLGAAAVAPTADLGVQDPPQADGDLQKASFTVHYARDGAPAVDVPLLIRIGGEVRTWRTDASGQVSLELPWPGLYEAFVGGTEARQMIAWHDFEERGDEYDYALAIPAGMDLDVRVVDGAGQPVVGAVVEASHGINAGSMLAELGRTDAEGHLRRRDLAARYGQVRAWGAGFVPSRIRNATVAAGKTCEIELKLPKKAQVAHGIVRDERGEPIAGARLALVQMQRRPTEPQFLTSGPDGTFVLDTLHVGAAALTGMHRGDVLRRGELRFEHDGSGAKNLEIRLRQGACVSGTLTRADGSPVATANVTARPLPNGIHGLPLLEGFTRTAADGSFSLPGLAAGRYKLETDDVENLVVDLRDGEQRQWDPVQQETVRVQFRVVDGVGKALAGWSVGVLPPGSIYVRRSALLQEDGRLDPDAMHGWEFPAGSYYRLSIHKRVRESAEPWSDYARLPSLITPPLVVGKDHKIRVPMQATTIHTLEGELVDGDGKPPAKAKVRIVGALGDPYRSEVPVDPATGMFHLTDQPAGRYDAWVVLPGKPNLPLPMLIARGEDGSVCSFGRTVVPSTGVVHATVADDDAAGLKLELVDAAGRSYPVRVRKDGTIRSGSLFYGDYQLRGANKTSRIEPVALNLAAAKQTVVPAFVEHVPTRVVVVFDDSHPRSASSWMGTISLSQEGRPLGSHKVRRDFFGTFPDEVAFELMLMPGTHKLHVKSWNNYVGEAEVVVPAGGGGSAIVRPR
ncbi:MAG: carboxypeptidase regulatory-like domain-containing protein, partial [Planctomycetota bacterium]